MAKLRSEEAELLRHGSQEIQQKHFCILDQFFPTLYLVLFLKLKEMC